MLRGPEPEPFRTQSYGARWYLDPLPDCQIAPATKDKWPSVTTIKKAWSKPFRKKLPTGETVPLDALWAAEFIADNLTAVTALGEDRGAIVTLCATAPARRLNAAADRGTGVHTLLENIAAGVGLDSMLLDPAVEPFAPACHEFIADWAPVWVAAEILCFNRDVGFAGTADSIITIQLDGKPFTAIVDWKSRGNAHGCYEDEVAQLGGYSLAEYIVVRSPIDGRPMRMEMPALDGGLIVSITADSYQLYPVDLGEAQIAFVGMHQSWLAHRGGQKAARKARQHPLLVPPSNAEIGELLEASLAAGGIVDESAPNDAIAIPTSSGDNVSLVVASVITTGNPSDRQMPSGSTEQALRRDDGEQPAEGSTAHTPLEGTPSAGPAPAPGPAVIKGNVERFNALAAGADEALAELHTARLDWLSDRIQVIKDHSPEALAMLAREWSTHDHIPTMKAGGPSDAEEIDVVARSCALVEKEHGIAFPPEEPGVELVTRALRKAGMT